MNTSLIDTKNKFTFINGFNLKRIAMISMVIDHIFSIIYRGVIQPYLNMGITISTDSGLPFYVIAFTQWSSIRDLIGSIALPIFCFLVTEGFIHTRDRKRYIINLGIFALISEIPFNLAFFNQYFNFTMQNIIFTLFIACLTLMFISNIEEKYNNKNRAKWSLVIIVIMLGMIGAVAIKAEYNWGVILAISLIYLLRSNRLLSILLGIIPLIMVRSSIWVLLSMIPILLYNGARGRGYKWGFYIFYPAHLLIFYFIANWFMKIPI